MEISLKSEACGGRGPEEPHKGRSPPKRYVCPWIFMGFRGRSAGRRRGDRAGESGRGEGGSSRGRQLPLKISRRSALSAAPATAAATRPPTLFHTRWGGLLDPTGGGGLGAFACLTSSRSGPGVYTLQVLERSRAVVPRGPRPASGRIRQGTRHGRRRKEPAARADLRLTRGP